MNVTPLAISDVVLVSFDVFTDERGSFYERFNEERFAAVGLPTAFRQDNHSSSVRRVLRGLHYQLARPQGKLVSCAFGAVFDVAADIRVGSPTFGKWVSAELSESKPEALWIPPGFAHGFCALTDVATVEYKCTDLYVPTDERGVLWSDADLGITWPVAEPVLSRRDLALPSLQRARADNVLPAYVARAGRAVGSGV